MDSGDPAQDCARAWLALEGSGAEENSAESGDEIAALKVTGKVASVFLNLSFLICEIKFQVICTLSWFCEAYIIHLACNRFHEK